MKRTDNTIDIAIAFDKNFITPFYVLLTSLFANNKKNQIVFHIIAEDITEEKKSDIHQFVQYNNSEIFFYLVDKTIVQQFVLSRESPHITPATYYRLYFPQLVPAGIKYLLYLDTDVIITGDLKSLFQTPLDNYAVGAVPDAKILKCPTLGIENEGGYFNAGVLLINIEEWAIQQITQKTIEFLNNFPGLIVLADQDALNAVLNKTWYKLDKAYNITFYDVPRNLKKTQVATYLKDKIIIHYTTQNKPWLPTCTNRLRNIYQYYFSKSPLSDSDDNVGRQLTIKDRYKILKRDIKEFLIDTGIDV